MSTITSEEYHAAMEYYREQLREVSEEIDELDTRITAAQRRRQGIHARIDALKERDKRGEVIPV